MTGSHREPIPDYQDQPDSDASSHDADRPSAPPEHLSPQNPTEPADLDLDPLSDLDLEGATISVDRFQQETDTQRHIGSGDHQNAQKSDANSANQTRNLPAAGQASSGDGRRQVDATGEVSWTVEDLAVIEALCDPSVAKLPAEQAAQAAGVTVYRWRKAKRDQEIMGEVRRRWAENLACKMPSVIDAAGDSALLLGRDGFGDRKMIFDRVFGPVTQRFEGNVTIDLGDRLQRALARRDELRSNGA